MRYCIIMNNEKQTSQLFFKLISTVVPFQTKERCCNIFIKTQRPLEFLHWLESGRTRFLRGSTRKQKLTFAEVSLERHEDRKMPGRWADGLPDARRGTWAGFCSPHSALRDGNRACACVSWHKLVSGHAGALTASAGESSSTTIYFTSWSSNTKSFLFLLSTSGAMCLETPGVFEMQINITSECHGLVLQKNTAGKFCLLLFVMQLISP